MKEIRAYIEPFMLSKVTQALLEIPDFPGMSVSDCYGFGRERVADSGFDPYMLKKRIEIFASDEQVDNIFSTVMQAANTYQRGAGKIYIIDVGGSGNISSGERYQKDPPSRPK
ncbi:MAG: P-II family nitrogen regulator [Nitrosospira multiformis]|nr:P-II family nitrogen regulator [Nitrosospira multiformis]